MPPTYLTGDKAGIEDFLSRYDVGCSNMTVILG
jgi:hypothetical protein